jgi:hypothetical protein
MAVMNTDKIKWAWSAEWRTQVGSADSDPHGKDNRMAGTHNSWHISLYIFSRMVLGTQLTSIFLILQKRYEYAKQIYEAVWFSELHHTI